MLGACSGSEVVGNTNKEKDQQEEEKENVLVFEIDGEKVEEKLIEADIQPHLAKKLYLPSGFTITPIDEKQFLAEGTGDYQDINVSISQEGAMPDLKLQLYDWYKWVKAVGGPGTVINEVDLNEQPILKQNFEYVAEVLNGMNSHTRYVAFKMGNEMTNFVYINIKDEAKRENHKDFALELLKKIQLAEPA